MLRSSRAFVSSAASGHAVNTWTKSLSIKTCNRPRNEPVTTSHGFVSGHAVALHKWHLDGIVLPSYMEER